MAGYDEPPTQAAGRTCSTLDRTAEPLLVAAISCTHAGQTRQGLAVFRPGEQGLGGVALLSVPYPWQIAGWQVDPYALHPYLLRVDLYTEDGGPGRRVVPVDR